MNVRPRHLFLVFLLAAPAVAFADRVELVNGSAFEGVVSSLDDATVEIQLAYGQLRLPRSAVLRVEKEETPLARFLARRDRLRSEPVGTARQWLELARWARGRDLDHGAREAALEAAALDPGLEGLAPMMRRWGYGLDRELGVWVKARGSRAASAATTAGPPRGPAVRHTEERLAGAIEMMARAEVERARTERARLDREIEASRAVPSEPPVQPVVTAPVAPIVRGYYPLILGSGWVFPPDPMEPDSSLESRSSPVNRNPSNRFARELLHHVPGSLIPIGSPIDNRAALRR